MLNNNEKKTLLDRIPAFSVVLVFVVLSVIGAANIPLLNIQYTPTIKSKSFNISYSWTGASSKVIESEVTSKLEGAIASVRGVQHISSTTRMGSGNINVELKPGENMEMIRFEIASLIREIYPKLPEGVTFPSFSTSISGENETPVMTYRINSDLPTHTIEQYIQNIIIKDLSLLEGVGRIQISGATPIYMEILYNPEYLRAYSLSISDLRQAISLSHMELNLGYVDMGGEELGIVIKSDMDRNDFENIPIKNINGRIVNLSDVATVSIKERTPTGYYRINGLNTINVTIYPEKYVNTINLCDNIKLKMSEIEEDFPENFSAIISRDISKDLKKDINKILKRTLLCVLILLVFVFIVSRSFRYLFVITVTMVANVLIAFIFYNLFNLEIHLYSLAGITVSLGLIIDTTIIMIAHYSYYRNRKAFMAILAALLTSIGSLLVIFFLPETERANLLDFAAVIIINLTVSLVIALIFVPSFITQYPISSKDTGIPYKRRRMAVKFSRGYERLLLFARRHRWAFIVIFILGFGLPVHMLPDKLEPKKGEEAGFWMDTYNKTIGSKWYQSHMKKPVEYALGGALRPFAKNVSSFYYGGGSATPRPTLNISARMPEGCTVQQLNDIMVVMENYLSQFDEIEMFTTSISSYDNGYIQVTFKRDVENSAIPLLIKSEIISKANSYGGASWSVSGIDDQYFNNYIGSTGYKSNRITLTGYNYDQLYSYCEMMSAMLLENRRVKDPEINGSDGYRSMLRNEFYIDYDKENLAIYDVSPAEAYSTIFNQLYSSTVMSYFDGESIMTVDLKSANKDKFDVWSLGNEYTETGERNLRFENFGRIEKRRTGNDIFRYDQEYRLFVGYDFIGSSELSRRVMNRTIEQFNDEILPIGYKADSPQYSWEKAKGKQYWLILLVIVIIYFICAILFESLIKPFAIVFLIPVSFIGLFLIFVITGTKFDQGGFASMIMLAGLTVNSGIYILNEYNLLPERKGRYLRAYNHKIIPVFLTILSTVLGLLPFLFDGPNEVFWYAFALGTIGGLTFSIIALFIYMPIFILPKDKRPKKRREKRKKGDISEVYTESETVG